MNSIRGRLIAILIGTTGLVWLLAAAWIYLSTQAQVEHVLDARLTEAARMVNSLLTDHRIELAMAEGENGETAAPIFDMGQPYERQLSCQIWSLDGQLVGRSSGAPDTRLTDATQGFSEATIAGETWRVYTVENPRLGVRVMVGDSLHVRDRLVGDVIKGLLLPATIVLPVLAGMIWLSVRRGLAPLSEMAGTLSSRDANDLRPLPSAGMPAEVAPAVNALNGLFRRVDEARERERNFTAFAAHELKTPLAGLKTQAQIALASGDGAVQANALRQIATGVDRTARLARQLLDLASLETGDGPARSAREDISVAIGTAVAEMKPLAAARNVAIEVEHVGGQLRLEVETHRISPALRNLLENAVNHSPEGAHVRCRIHQNGGTVLVSVEDEGQGVTETELPRLTEKFFRGRNKSTTGSGLGLAIARTAVEQAGGELRLANRTPQGFVATLVLPV